MTRRKSRLADRAKLGAGALLITGGALLSVWAGHAVLSGRIVIDRVSSIVPEDAVAAIVFDRTDGTVFEAASRFPAPAQRALLAADLTGEQTAFFLRPDGDSWSFGYITEAVVDPKMLPEKYYLGRFGAMTAVFEGSPEFGAPETGLRLVAKNASGWGFMRREKEDKALPFSFARESDGAFRFTAGHRFRGLPADLGRLPSESAITAFPTTAMQYYADDRHPRILDRYLETLTETGLELDSAFLPVLTALRGKVEWLTAKPDDDVSAPHFLVTVKRHEQDLEHLNEAVRGYLGRKDPERIEFLLPDGTTSTELRNGSAFVRMETTEPVENVFLHTFSSLNGMTNVYILVDNDERIWISSSKNLITGALLNDLRAHQNAEACRPNGRFPSHVLFKPDEASGQIKNALTEAVFGQFERAVYLLNDDETGLFTVCGYF